VGRVDAQLFTVLDSSETRLDSAKQREWLIEFFNRLAAHLSETSVCQAEHFMQMQVIDEMSHCARNL